MKNKKKFVDEHNKTEDHTEKMNQYCVLTDEDTRVDFIKKHRDEYVAHMKEMKIKISDERKDSIRDRLAEMKAFKTELRERISDMTDEEKQHLREDFIEKAKDM